MKLQESHRHIIIWIQESHQDYYLIQVW